MVFPLKSPFSYGFPMVFPLKPPFSYGFPGIKTAGTFGRWQRDFHEAVADVGDAVPTVPPLPDALPTAGEVRGTSRGWRGE